MKRKRTAMLIRWTGRWAAVAAIVLSVLSAQQSWGAIACHCESHPKLAPAGNHCELHSDEVPETDSLCGGEAPDAKGVVETDHASSRHKASGPSSVNESAMVPNAAHGGVAPSSSKSISCCCFAQSSGDEPWITLSTTQPIPVEDAPGTIASGTFATTASANIHRPPESACSRPLYIVQSSLLI